MEIIERIRAKKEDYKDLLEGKSVSKTLRYFNDEILELNKKFNRAEQAETLEKLLGIKLLYTTYNSYFSRNIQPIIDKKRDDEISQSPTQEKREAKVQAKVEEGDRNEDKNISKSSKSKPIKTDKSKKSKVKIELNNGEIKETSEEFLKSYYVVDEAFDENLILEKNIYAFKSENGGIEMDLEKLGGILKKKSFIENYSLVIHEDSERFKVIVYRLIDNEFYELKKINSGVFAVDMEEMRKISMKRFYEGLENRLE